MQGGKRALTPWNKFVKKVYAEGKEKNSSYSFQEALKDASNRKSEMGSENKLAHGTKIKHVTKKSRRKRFSSHIAGSKRRRSTRKRKH